MDPTPTFYETHSRTARFTIGRHELTKILREAALAMCGLPDSDAVTVEIRIEDAMEGGSLSYKTGSLAKVVVTENLLHHDQNTA